ncbi:MAG TPA: DoxX family protein [Bacteroidia bacterium]|nr:DoxX family protein [Bacteroidia bacterium]
MTIALWIVESLLGLIFVITGSFKFFQTKEKVIASGGTWAEDFKPGIIKVIAATELISGLFVILPRLLGHGHYLTFMAAFGIASIMTGSIYTHIRRKEFKHAFINSVFLLMALFVAYGCRPV